MRRIAFGVVLVLLAGCGTGSPPADSQDPGAPADAADASSAVECCPMDPPSCNCPRIGGSVAAGHLDRCPRVCDSVPVGWERTVDELGCPRWKTAAASCLACVPESPEELCAAAGRSCGELQTTDRCGGARSIVSCGTCGGDSTQQCVDGKCIALPETDAAFCARLDRHCGRAEGTDNLGQHRIADCGNCGDVAQECVDGTCWSVEYSESDEEFCRHRGAECGTLTGVDNMSMVRVVDCGSCPEGKVCNATTNRCG